MKYLQGDIWLTAREGHLRYFLLILQHIKWRNGRNTNISKIAFTSTIRAHTHSSASNYFKKKPNCTETAKISLHLCFFEGIYFSTATIQLSPPHKVILTCPHSWPSHCEGEVRYYVSLWWIASLLESMGFFWICSKEERGQPREFAVEVLRLLVG